MHILRVLDSGEEYTSSNPTKVREHRNRLLAETDYLALSDVTMSDNMKTYRQALRDIPQQSSFPTSFIIPIKPE
tara:strand:- start:126 stop:347 length:222 start_codon:yes stop_codon:yes gene_type:complete